MLLVDTTGAKYPLFLMLRTTKLKIKSIIQENLTDRQGYGKTVWKSVAPLQEKFKCQIYANPTVWWNSSISIEFLRFHFAYRPDRATKKILLLWDDFSAHFTDDVVAYATSVNWLDLIRSQIQQTLQGNAIEVQGPSAVEIYDSCNLLKGEIQENFNEGGYVDDDVLTELMDGLAVEDMIHPSSDIRNVDDSTDEPVGDSTLIG
ncbi:hypothetical protein DYB25_014275 [Aphanomyces astaci]|uniref:DDE-1 domain-containing protein n=1 Tax=Aphanomyces astaci TaxID=112090 RepID=A0A397FL16_APHAT|nr:hypothetical protein DYB25_014275 [Aphanomyces astaci]RHY39211.1 hypothetical protein DYB30_011075 [Aphanomyces astaci]RHY48223.1 hypothetical protein DYB34_013710 [Aphanomyces astaci]RHZ29657.1 hypothetical protein DYB31_010758 [Aphanomyces astaci]